MAAKFADVAKIKLKGDHNVASTLINQAKRLMGLMLEEMDLGGHPTREKTVEVDQRFLPQGEQEVDRKKIAAEAGEVVLKTIRSGYTATIKLLANLNGEAPIIAIEIDVQPFFRYETEKSLFYNEIFSAAFVGRYGSDGDVGTESVPLVNGYPGDEDYLSNFEPGEVITTIVSNPLPEHRYRFWGDMILIPPEGQTENLLLGQRRWGWANSDTAEAEMISMGQFNNEATFFNPVFEHGKVVLGSIETTYIADIDRFGYTQQVHYAECFTSIGASTCNFNYYPGLKEFLGQEGDVGVFGSPKEENESLDIAPADGQFQEILFGFNPTLYYYQINEGLGIQWETTDGWYVIAYEGQTEVSFAYATHNIMTYIGVGAFIQNVCLTLGKVLTLTAPVYHEKSALRFNSLLSGETYLLKGVSLLNPKEGVIVHYDGTEGDIANELFELVEITEENRPAEVGTAMNATPRLKKSVTEILGKYKPTYQKFWFADLI